jgi:hypothetical protein
MSVIFKDEFHGEGGSFVLDPATGLRTRTGEPVAMPASPTEAELARAGAELADAETILKRSTKGGAKS